MKHKLNNEHYAYGANIKTTIAKKIAGRFTMSGDDGGAIAACVAECPGDHIEIGVLYGGSLILAALAKKRAGQTGMIYGVDPFGWAEGQTRGEHPEPSAELVMANAKLCGVEDRIAVFTQSHPPLPSELENLNFDTAFIDGNHFYDGARDDWDNLKNRVRKYVLMHDVTLHKYMSKHCGKVFREAQKEGWRTIYLKSKMGILERVMEMTGGIGLELIPVDELEVYRKDSEDKQLLLRVARAAEGLLSTRINNVRIADHECGCFMIDETRHWCAFHNLEEALKEVEHLL